MTKLIRKNTFVVAPKNFATDTIEIVNLNFLKSQLSGISGQFKKKETEKYESTKVYEGKVRNKNG